MINPKKSEIGKEYHTAFTPRFVIRGSIKTSGSKIRNWRNSDKKRAGNAFPSD